MAYTPPKSPQAYGPYGKLVMPKAWTDEDRETLTRLYRLGHGPSEIAKIMGRTSGQISGQVHRLGIRRAEQTVRETARLNGRRGMQKMAAKGLEVRQRGK